MINYFVILMLLILLAKQITFIRKIQIRTKKSTFEIGVFSVALLALAVLTIFFAKGYMHYLIALTGASFLLINWMKQGLASSGLLIVSRGKEEYAWREISSAKIKTSDKINIDFFNTSGRRIASHSYEMKHYKDLMKLLRYNKVKVDVIKSV